MTENTATLKPVTFAPENTFAVGGTPVFVSVVDVNDDSNLDIVTLNITDNTISLLIGDGRGIFTTLTTFGIGKNLFFASIAYVNNDGNLDIVTGNEKDISVLRGNGHGNFSSPMTFLTGSYPSALSIADVNSDGNTDIVTGTDEFILVLLNDGSDNFFTQKTFATGGYYISAMNVVDVNSDGNVDMVTANWDSNNISVLLNDGKGNFALQTTFAVGLSPFSMGATDINNDGNADVVTANVGSNDISLLLNDGKGSFAPQKTFTVGLSPLSLGLADVNGDGNVDVVTANFDSNNISVLLGDGQGNFAEQLTFTVSHPFSISITDVNGDGKADVITTEKDDNEISETGINNVSVLLNTTEGTFIKPTPVKPVVATPEIPTYEIPIKFNGGKGDDIYFVSSEGIYHSSGITVMPNGELMPNQKIEEVIEQENEGTDEVRSSITYTLPANVENLNFLYFGGGGLIDGYGNELKNVLTGNDYANELWGLAGDDVLNGELGDDSLFGGDGDDMLNPGDGYYDLLNGGNGTDTAVINGFFADYKFDYFDHFKTQTIETLGLTNNISYEKNSSIDFFVNIEKLQFKDVTVDVQAYKPILAQITHNEMVHTGALFAILSYGEYSLWIDQHEGSWGKDWKNYSGVADEGFDDNYKAFFTDHENHLGKTWELLTNEQLGNFSVNNAHAAFTAGGLYHGYINSGIPATTQNTKIGGVLYGDANAIVTTDGDTLVLAFRGTDGEDTALAGGQAFTGDGQYLHYEAFRPLIEKVYQYAQNNSDIRHIVVSGHSLGGAMTDIFSAVDGKRFDELANSDLTVVAMASAGLDANAFNDDDSATFNNYDHDVIEGFNTSVKDYISKLSTPNFYVGLAHNQDRVFHSQTNALVNATIDSNGINVSDIFKTGLAPVDALIYNAHFKTTDLNVPNLANTDVDYNAGISLNPDGGFGAHHNGVIYYSNLDALYSSSLINNYINQNLIFGTNNYVNQSEWFEGKSIDDNGKRKLVGSTKADFILGLDGNDVLEGKNGTDLLDGGDGNDTLTGGAGSDKMVGGAGSDKFIFSAISDSAIGTLRDVISDFVSGLDKIDLSAIDANTTTKANDAFKTLELGTKDIVFKLTNALYFNTATHILYGNNDKDNAADFSIELSGVNSLVKSDFVL